jgi:predicted extracellular nuclease
MVRIGASLAMALVAGSLLVSPAAASPNGLVISEFRFRGPAGGNDEFIELLNTSDGDIDISGYALQGCASASGAPSNRAVVPSNVVLEADQHYLFTNSAAGGYSGTVAGDQTYATGISDNAGTRIVNGAGTVIDAVASSASVATTQCLEGTGVNNPQSTGTVAAFQRLANETQDTDNNAADFTGPSAGDPQNKAGGGGDPEPTITKIHSIQGPDATTPLANQIVTIEGVVVGHDDEDGFNFERNFPEDRGIFVQEETADQDSNASTSEGIFVGFVDNVLDYPLGSVVRVEGQAKEKFGLTMIAESIGQEPEIIGSATLPDAVTIDPGLAEAQTEANKTYYETLENMRVRLAEGTANSGGTTKFGELFLTPGTERDRVFRVESVPALLATDADAGAGDPQNPYKDEDGSFTTVEGDLFDTVQNVVGPLAFSFNHYKIMVQANVMPTVIKGPTEYPFTGVSEAAANELRVASFNVENFFGIGEISDRTPVTPEEYQEKRDSIIDAIDRLLKRPDIVAVQEVSTIEVLEDIATGLGGYSAYLEPGNDERGIDVGFLISDRVDVNSVTQVGKEAPGSCSDVAGRLFDRPPLVADVSVNDLDFSIFTNHFSSKSAPDSCREAQANFVADRVQEIEGAGGDAIVAGDLNAFETEGALSILQAKTSLDNLWSRTPNQERYSYAFDGKLQTLDHILITDGLEDAFGAFQYAHFDNDYYERDSAGDGHKLSDHDPPLATFTLDACPNGDDRATVFVRNVNSKVTNYDTGDGCTINDLIVEENFPKKDQLKAHVDEVTQDLFEAGIITKSERDDIRKAANKAKPA